MGDARRTRALAQARSGQGSPLWLYMKGFRRLRAYHVNRSRVYEVVFATLGALAMAQFKPYTPINWDFDWPQTEPTPSTAPSDDDASPLEASGSGRFGESGAPDVEAEDGVDASEPGAWKGPSTDPEAIEHFPAVDPSENEIESAGPGRRFRRK